MLGEVGLRPGAADSSLAADLAVGRGFRVPWPDPPSMPANDYHRPGHHDQSRAQERRVEKPLIRENLGQDLRWTVWADPTVT